MTRNRLLDCNIKHVELEQHRHTPAEYQALGSGNIQVLGNTERGIAAVAALPLKARPIRICSWITHIRARLCTSLKVG